MSLESRYSTMNDGISCQQGRVHIAKIAAKHKGAIIVTICDMITTRPVMENGTMTSPQDNAPRRSLTRRYSIRQTSPPTPPTAIHPALRPVSVFSTTSSSAESTSTVGVRYEQMSTGSRPSTSLTIGRGYMSMRPGILPNSDWTTGLSYDEMREASFVESEKRSEKKRWLRTCKEEVKENFKSFDRAFWG